MVVKNVFLQALLMTLLVFGIGLVFGLILENNRSDKAEVALLNSEVRALDQQLRIKAVNDFNVSCNSAKESLFNFADDVYLEAKELELYYGSHKFKNTFEILHKKYDLLRFMLWGESNNLRERCGYSFHTAVYLYSYKTETLDKKAMQNYYSSFLTDFKNTYAENLFLLPMAADLNISSIEIAMEKYEIESLPVIILDDKYVISESDLTVMHDLMNGRGSYVGNNSSVRQISYSFS